MKQGVSYEEKDKIVHQLLLTKIDSDKTKQSLA